MRSITKTLSIPVDGKSTDFRLTKLDAFSGVSLLRMLSRMPENTPSNVIPGEAEGSPDPQSPDVISTKADGRAEKSLSPVFLLFVSLPDTDLHALMTVCLEHTEVLLPAGWMPVMTRGEWSYPELEHDPAVCLKLTLEEVLWTLEGFFGGGGSASRKEIPGS